MNTVSSEAVIEVYNLNISTGGVVVLSRKQRKMEIEREKEEERARGE